MVGGENGGQSAERAGFITEELPSNSILFGDKEHHDNEYSIYFGTNEENRHQWLAKVICLSEGEYNCVVEGTYDTLLTQELIQKYIMDRAGADNVKVTFVPGNNSD